MEKKLYRYIGFEDFVNLLVNNKDRFVRPITWDDKYEGYLFSHMETKDDIREIVTEMYYYLWKLRVEKSVLLEKVCGKIYIREVYKSLFGDLVKPDRLILWGTENLNVS